jgi:hypothetical protein
MRRCVRIGPAVIAVVFFGCGRAATPRAAGPPTQADTVIECVALGGTRHILKIRADGHSADDLTLGGNTGTAEVTDAEYRLRFPVAPPSGGYHLEFRINRYTGEGDRYLKDQRGQVVEARGGDSLIQCSPYTGKPL